jgi:hypothetical protein
MKHIWLIESSAGRKWNVAVREIFYSKNRAQGRAKSEAMETPGLKWRVAKYERVK